MQQLEIRRNFIGFPPKKTVVHSFAAIALLTTGVVLESTSVIEMDPSSSFGLESAKLQVRFVREPRLPANRSSVSDKRGSSTKAENVTANGRIGANRFFGKTGKSQK